MKYAVKVTSKFRDDKFVDYVGIGGKCWINKNDVNGWKRFSSAEKWIENWERFERHFGISSLFEYEYEIITL